MPKLYEFDNFEECSKTTKPFEFPKQYCIISAYLVARDDDKKIMKGIEKFSKNERHFNHTVLKRGICLSDCLRVHAALKDKIEMYVNDEAVVLNIPKAEGKKIMLNKLANACINKELIDYYGVMAETSIDYCINDDPISHVNFNAYFFVVVLGAFLMLSIAGIYDLLKESSIMLKKFENWKRLRHFLAAFSFKQNFKALVSNNTATNLERDNELHLTRLYGIKILLMFLFVINQVYRQIVAMPFANPIFIEKVFKFDDFRRLMRLKSASAH